jgi:hypothetical protein
MTVLIYAKEAVIGHAFNAALSTFLPGDYQNVSQASDVLQHPAKDPILVAYCHEDADISMLMRVRRERPQMPILGIAGMSSRKMVDALRDEGFDAYPGMGYMPMLVQLHKYMEERK